VNERDSSTTTVREVVDGLGRPEHPSAHDEVIAAALDAAHVLVRAGVPVFVAKPATRADGSWDPAGGHGGSGYWLPGGWERTTPSLATVNTWKPGMALCAVTGLVVDLVDVDDRNGGAQTASGLRAAGMWPTAYAEAATPSGGSHAFVAALGVRSRDAVRPGLDVKAGAPDGAGRGFAFIAPTAKLSKTTGEVAAYTWTRPPDPDELAEADGDDTGQAVAEMVRAAHRSSRATAAEGEPGRDEARAWMVADPVPRGSRYPWLRSYAGWLRHHRVRRAEAEVMMRRRWEACEQPPDYPMPWSDALALLADVYDRYPAGDEAPPVAVLDGAGDELVPVDEDTRAAVRQRFPRLDLAALLADDRPPRRWVLDGLIPEGASVALVAPAGTGKSLLLLAGMIAVARGDRTFAGLGVTRRRVLLVDMENTEDDLADRLQALGVTTADVGALDELVPIHLPPLAPLDTAIGGSELAAILDTYDVQAGDVVVLDSLQRVINGAENDSDTMRAYYRHTAVMLKRRGLTVVRADNTGKDTDKGARGTSGKRDDVDVELILVADAEKPNRLRLRPGKVRLPGVQSVLINREIDDDGRLTFTTAGDPFRALVADAHQLLDNLAIPVEAGERKAADAIKTSGHKVVRAALRAAIRERRNPLWGAPNTLGAPLRAPDRIECAEPTRRTDGAPAGNTESERENRAEQPRRTFGAHASGAHGGGAPPLPAL